MSKRAVILAGGIGSRLRPYTVVLPKPLMPIGNFPILEVVIRQLAYYGFDRITLAVNHQAEIIKSFFNSGEKWGIRIDYSFEKTPLGTMGPLKLIKDLPENFLVMNGDILTDLDFEKFYMDHVTSDQIFTISSCMRTQPSDFGVLEIDENRMLYGFQEKPVMEYEVSMGIYMLSKKILKDIPDNRPYGFDALMLGFIKDRKKVGVLQHHGYWLDIGRPDDYIQAIEMFEEKKERFLKN
ncbi:NDP-sugar synthase [Thermodesulfobacteriota bacterium]